MLWALIIPSIVHGVELPMGSAPQALEVEHFPSRLHTFVWRNWPLVPTERMADVVGAAPADILALGESMGLPKPPKITEDQWRRSYITIIRRNWHLLTYDQLLALLNWSAEEMAFCLREDDFLFIKLGLLKPACEPLRFAPPDKEAEERAAAIAGIVEKHFPEGIPKPQEKLFRFVKELSAPPKEEAEPPGPNRFSPRYCYSYFALYGDPLLDEDLDPYPDGYLARLANTGVSGVWLQGVLYRLAPFPWDESLSTGYEKRLANLRKLVKRAGKHGVGIYLYLNEPRAMPLSFFEQHPELKGVVEGDHATLCTSVPEVQAYLRDAVASICEAVPDLAGFFTITASENLTNCWSHGRGGDCARCSERGPAVVIPEVNALFQEGITHAGSKTRLIAWDWGWADTWSEDAINRLPEGVAQMSVSEWSIPIKRGGIDSMIGEYSISEVGPGPRALRHWGIAQARGLKTLAKVQANNTWELSAVPYIPAVANVAQHAANLRETGIDGIMLSWTLGGHPSPNLEVFAEIGQHAESSVDEALLAVAEKRFGKALAPAVVEAWRGFSAAFREFPYHISTVYNAPMQMGPANLLWPMPTGYASTMVGIPYDNVDVWRSVYPADVFAAQFEKVSSGFSEAADRLREASEAILQGKRNAALDSELDIAEACAIHFGSVANQVRFVLARDQLAGIDGPAQAEPILAALADILDRETALARRLWDVQTRDSRIGFEASNQYFYVPMDLLEKIVNCEYLRTQWLADERSRRAQAPAKAPGQAG